MWYVMEVAIKITIFVCSGLIIALAVRYRESYNNFNDVDNSNIVLMQSAKDVMLGRKFRELKKLSDVDKISRLEELLSEID